MQSQLSNQVDISLPPPPPLNQDKYFVPVTLLFEDKPCGVTIQMKRCWHSNNDFFGFTKQSLIFFIFILWPRLKVKELNCVVQTLENVNRELQDV